MLFDVWELQSRHPLRVTRVRTMRATWVPDVQQRLREQYGDDVLTRMFVRPKSERYVWENDND